jgi:23S rRNA pseudouridine1911/1915/1917 synthase
MREFEYIIAKDHMEDRLDHFLALKKEMGLTRSQIRRLIDDGYVEVNKEIPKASHKIKTDDRIVIKIPAPKKLEVLPENILLEIMYEDEDLVVVNKPRGMVVHPGAGRDSGTLVNALLYHCENLSGIGGVLRPGIVHRLDKDTSGLMVVAKNDFAHNALSRQFKARKVFKQYLALVHGVVNDDEGKIEGKIGRHPMHRKKMAIINTYEARVKGREAVTFYRVLERFKNYSLVEVTLKTGRMHQIRVHLTSIGHPIVGDPTYGHRREEYKTRGQLLHAAKIGFTHPRSGQYLEFFRDMPEDMASIVNELRKRR